jgi:hypothetical protein
VNAAFMTEKLRLWESFPLSCRISSPAFRPAGRRGLLMVMH